MKRKQVDKLSKFKFYSISLPADVNGKMQVKIPIPPYVTEPVVYLITSKKKKKIKGEKSKDRYIIEIKESGIFAIGNKFDRKKEYEKPSQFADYTDKGTNIQFHANAGILNHDKSIKALELPYESGIALAEQEKVQKLLQSIFIKKEISVEQALQEVDPTEMPEIIDAENQEFTDMLQYMEEFCKSLYESEAERENSILQQASNMQSAFSFITAGLFVIAQIVFDHLNASSRISFTQVFIGFSFITAWLLMSLIFATLAQSRKIRKKANPSAIQFIQHANVYYNLMVDKNKRHAFMITEYQEMADELNIINNWRVRLVKFSMTFFYGAIAESVVMSFLMAMQAGLIQ